MKEKNNRNLKLLEMRKAGFSYEKIGRAFGLNKKTVWEIIDRYVKRKKKK